MNRISCSICRKRPIHYRVTGKFRLFIALTFSSSISGPAPFLRCTLRFTDRFQNLQEKRISYIDISIGQTSSGLTVLRQILFVFNNLDLIIIWDFLFFTNEIPQAEKDRAALLFVSSSFASTYLADRGVQWSLPPPARWWIHISVLVLLSTRSPLFTFRTGDLFPRSYHFWALSCSLVSGVKEMFQSADLHWRLSSYSSYLDVSSCKWHNIKSTPFWV